MKKILFVALAATLLAAGCQKTEIINRVGDRIGFTSEMGKLTKAASEEGLATLKTQSFYVWAYCAYTDVINDFEPGDVHEDMEYLTVSHNDTDGWHTEADYYWPGKNKDLDFFAVSSKSVAETQVIPVGGKVAEGARTLTITDYVVDNTTATDDLMVADFVRQNQDENEKVVNLTFRHTLSKVQFLFMTSENADKEVIVKSVTVSDVVTKGSLAVSETADARFTWTPSTVEGDAKMFTKTENLTLTKDAKDYATWLVLPQGIVEDPDAETLTGLTVEVVYTMGGKEFTSSFPLYKSDLKKWAPNQYIKYTVLLTPNVIKFNPTVEDWSDPSTDVDMVN